MIVFVSPFLTVSFQKGCLRGVPINHGMNSFHCHVQPRAVLLCQRIAFHLLGLPEWVKVISGKKGWKTEHTGCTREVNSSVISFSLQSELKCTNSWCTPAPGFRSYLPHIFSSGGVHFSVFVKCYFLVFFYISFAFILLVLYLGYISFLKIVCLPKKNKRLKRKKIRNLKYSVCLIYTNWKGMDIRCMKRKAEISIFWCWFYLWVKW